jgi:NAD(P)-dependent dehydrogenase (short-subunit alcohol dehydrogenase family)
MSERKAIFVTGAASGIGRATARRFGQAGWLVGIYDLDDAGLGTLGAELGAGGFVAGHLDVTDRGAWPAALDGFAAASGGRLDVLFNCAGVLTMGRFGEMAPEAERRTVAVNIEGVLHGIRAALPLLRQTPGAAIVSMSSASAIYGVPELAVYSASKFFVRGLTEALDLELRADGIRVADIMPGYVDTPMVSGQSYRAGTLRTLGVQMKPEAVAELVWRAAHGNRLHWMGSADLKVMSRLGGLFPSLGRRLMRRLAKL